MMAAAVEHYAADSAFLEKLQALYATQQSQYVFLHVRISYENAHILYL